MIQLEEKAAEALACVQKAETIMAELGHTKYFLSGMCSAAMRHDLEKEVCELLGKLAEARKQRDTLTKAMTEYMNFHIQHGFVTTAETIKAWQALAAVKGGSHE